MLSPHFPPDSTAGTHRVRLLAPHLPAQGWEPVVVTVDPAGYEGRLDPALLSLVPPGLRVIRCPAWSPRWTRPLGIGDLGLRAFTALRRTCADLLERERFDALFITIYPTYPALLGPLLKRRFRVPFVLDYQDPWMGAWGDTVGGGVDGQVDWKSRATRRLACWLEPRAVAAADAMTAVSSATFEAVVERYGELAPSECAVLPIGGEPADFEALRHASMNNPYFDRRDGLCHLSYVGTLLPLGAETLSAVLEAVALLKVRRADLYARVRLHFFGTSNQTAGEPANRVRPIAESIGVADCVSEVPLRVPYLDALKILLDSQVLLLMGSSERHYTASKLYPALLAKRPLIAVYHEASSVVATLTRVGRAPSVRLIVFGDRGAAESIERIYEALVAAVSLPEYDSAAIDLDALHQYSAGAVAARLAAVLNRVVSAAA
jgi:Glycosyl transferase 4-like domain